MLGERRSGCVVAVVKFEGGPWLDAPLSARGGVPPVGELVDHHCDRCGVMTATVVIRPRLRPDGCERQLPVCHSDEATCAGHALDGTEQRSDLSIGQEGGRRWTNYRCALPTKPTRFVDDGHDIADKQ